MATKEIAQVRSLTKKDIKAINMEISDTISRYKNNNDKKGLLYEIGVQTLPGLILKINGNPVIIGRTGIFNLNTENFGEIKSVNIVIEDEYVNNITTSNNFYFILDMIFTIDNEGGSITP